MIRLRILSAAAGMTGLLISRAALGDQYDPPATYYQNATGAGATLKSQLFTITSTGFIKRSYGDTRYAMGTGQGSIGGGFLDLDPSNSANVLNVYNRLSVNAQWAGGTLSTTFNREHVWPKHWLNLTSSQVDNGYLGIASDLFEVRPTTPSVNSARGDLGYGPINGSGTYGANSGYWYPGDADRGDLARSLFYMATRYGEGQSNNLTLVNGPPVNLYTMGDLASLLKWHYADPIDNAERRRNQYVYSQALNPLYYQNNRNPYIDHPEWVWSIFGGGNNNSQLSIAAADSAGASSINVNLGRVMLNGSISPQSVTLSKSGANPTTFNITTTGSASSTLAGERQAFDYNAQSRGMSVSLTSTASTGAKSGTVVVDNTDISSGGAGLGSADGDDVVDVSATVVANRSITATPVVFGNVIVGYSGALDTTLSTTGDDNNFTRVTVKGNGGAADSNGVSLLAGPDVQFDTDGETSTRSLFAQFDTPGRKFGSISMLRQGEGLAGEVDAPVVVNYGAIVRPHSDASFSDAANVESILLDLGTVKPGDSLKQRHFGLFNIAGAGAAGLDLKSIFASGDTSAFATDLASFAQILGGDEGLFTATLNPNILGDFSATYQLHLGDEKLPGATDGQLLTIHLTGTVVPEPGALLLASIFLIGLSRRRTTQSGDGINSHR
jgi:endonuclease I